MAANDYYNPTATPANNSLPPHPQFQSHITPAVPPLTTTQPYPEHDPFTRPPTNASPISPFETPFDDRIYPAGRPTNQPYDSQSSLGADSRYYGQGGGGRPQDSTGSFRDDIPLQNHPSVPPKDHYVNDQDHVYDAPIRPANLEAGRPNRNSSRLGMNKPKKSKWKQPWVCYIFGLVQIIVFIVEIVRNCKFPCLDVYLHADNYQHNSLAHPSPSSRISTS